MTIRENKQLVLSWFESLVQGDPERAVGLMHEEFRYFLPGTLPASGWWEREGFLASTQMFAGVLAGPITMRVGEVTAEGDRVWFEAESDAPLVGGGRYTNTYVFAVRVREDKIAEFKEFSDTLHVFEAIDAPETRGPRKQRQSPLQRVTNTIEGASVGEALPS
jgi:ketosteroid isomerase-like protein